MGDDKDASDTIEHAPIAGPLGKIRATQVHFHIVMLQKKRGGWNDIVCGTKVDVFNMFILCMSMI